MDAAVHLILRDADPSGIVTATRDNWTGIAYGMPVADFSLMSPILKTSGVYVFTGVADLGSEEEQVIYIGEAETIADRITPRHTQFSKEDVFWRRIVVFTSTGADLHKAHVKWLESALVKRARDASRYRLTNGNDQSENGLPEFDLVFVKRFLENMLVLYPLLGVDAFRVPDASLVSTSAASVSASATGGELGVPVVLGVYVGKVSAPIARGVEKDGAFIILGGSLIKREHTDSSGGNTKKSKGLLLQAGRLTEEDDTWYRLEGDYETTSPSAAASLVLGYSASGTREWKPIVTNKEQ